MLQRNEETNQSHRAIRPHHDAHRHPAAARPTPELPPFATTIDDIGEANPRAFLPKSGKPLAGSSPAVENEDEARGGPRPKKRSVPRLCQRGLLTRRRGR